MKKQLTVDIGQSSSAGRKTINQDFHGAFAPKEPLLSSKGISVAIADGISSSDVSQIASETAIKSFLQDYYCTSDAWSVKTSAQRVLSATNSWLYSQSQHSPYRFDKDKGYICTFSAVIFKSNTAHIFHSGDSRVLYISEQHIEQLTTDHRREVSPEVSYLTRGLGIHNYLEVDYTTFPISAGDIFILATDGVYEYLTEKILLDTISKGLDNLDKTAQQLIDHAYTAGSDDNLTIQIAVVKNVSEKSLAEAQEKTTLLPPAQKLQARKDFDGYHILRELYTSSRSHIYLAQDIDTGNKVALKIPSMEMKNNSHHLDSFLMEEWILKRINNAHIIKPTETSRKKNFLYTASEYIEGKTLAQWMIDNPEPNIDIVRSIITQVAKGLQALHRQEIIHQDLRPNNIMIDQSGTVKIIDLGSAKVAGIAEIVVQDDGGLMTAQYTAPEHFIGKASTNLSDLFSLGVITYQMLSGKLPYGNNVSKTYNVKTQQRLYYRSLLNNDNNIPGWVEYAIKKAVDINPAKRYLDVSEFIYELSHPSAHYLSQSKPPLIERNPVLFWQSISLILAAALIYQSLR